jgi:hypothetical protein
MSTASHLTTSPGLRVVEAVADAEGIDPIDLEAPLYESIDPTALDDLFDKSAGSTAARSGSLSFRYHGYDITIASSGAVHLE